MPIKTINDNEDRKILEVFYTGYGTKLFVEDGVLVEQKIKSLPSSSAVPVVRNNITVPSPSPMVGGISSRPLSNPLYSPHPPPPRKALSLEEIKKYSYEESIKTAQEALAYYNRKRPTKYALVRPIESNSFKSNGGFWFHSFFVARPEKDVGDSHDRCFFAELKANGAKLGMPNFLVTFCRPIDGTQTTLGCEICDSMPHPLSGFLKGNSQPRALRSSRGDSSSGVTTWKGCEDWGSRKKRLFCLKIEDLHKYIPSRNASEDEWMQYM